MMDIETMSYHPNAIILNIGAIGFDPLSTDVYDQHSFYARIDVESQVNRHEDPKTMEWWSKQSPQAIDEAFGDGDDRISLEDALIDLDKLARKCARVWTNGIAFDMPILEHAYREINRAYPWQFWNVFDCRTIIKMNSIRQVGNSHHALEDCLNQITILQDSLKRLGVKKIG